jgi:hypothetical protein
MRCVSRACLESCFSRNLNKWISRACTNVLKAAFSRILNKQVSRACLESCSSRKSMQRLKYWDILDWVCLCLSFKGAGWLVLCWINAAYLLWHTGYADLEWTFWAQFESWHMSGTFLLCPQRVRNVDYLLIAKPVAISALGNPPWSGEAICRS